MTEVYELIKIHLACGRRRLPGFVHIDIRAECEPDVVGDALNLDMIHEGTVELLYFCHGLEHIAKPDVAKCLAGFRRVLRPGGVLRLSVPDFHVIAELYLHDRTSLWRLGCINGRQDHRDNLHYAVYDYEYLAWHLSESGFYDIRRWKPRDVHPPGYDDYSHAKINGRMISLNVEATAK